MAEVKLSPQELIQRARQGYDAFANGDLDRLRELIDPNVLWHVGGRSRFARDYRGLDDVFENFFAPILSETGGSLRNEVHDILASDDHVVVLFSQTAERNGKRLTARFANIEHVRDGRVVESWFFPEDAYALDEFYS